uniref:EAL domain-containing protein n=1 Tax=Bosea sp. NBC_00436 TaxID=2969620 RepID=A0A9E8CSG6_9HYPH
MDRVHPDDQQKVAAFWHAVMSEGINATEVRYLAPDGKQTWLSLRAERKDEHRLIGISFDIADRKAAEEAIWRTANHDPLTGLANRALFQSRLEEALRHAEASKSGVGLLLLDLDDFKDINDTLGHAVGDRLLQEIALRLANLVRESDTVARVGTATASFILNELHRAGVSIALDDFGTGFASLVHLKQFPVDHIKIDQSFVRNLTSDRSDAAIVAAIVNLGHAMGIHTTAEGVENIEQAKRLREAGCDFAQGYLYAKPRPGAEVPKTIQTWSPVRNPGPSGSVSV